MSLYSKARKFNKDSKKVQCLRKKVQCLRSYDDLKTIEQILIFRFAGPPAPLKVVTIQFIKTAD